MENNGKKTSRRHILKLGALGLGAVGAMSFARRAEAEAEITKKAMQKAVMFQSTPKNGKQCSDCQHFEPPAACRIVEGEVAPEAYCMLFSTKS